MWNIKDNQVRLDIEVSSLCNAACPNCPRNVNGGATSKVFNETYITFSQFRSWFNEKTINRQKRLQFCGTFGDPITNPDLMDIVTYVKDNRNDIKNLDNENLQFNTNGSLKSTEWWYKFGKLLSEMPGSFVIWSIDGLEDTNHLYRRNTDFNKIIENVKAFIDGGGVAHWDYLIFKHNEHQVTEAMNLAKELGFKKFFKKDPLGFENSKNMNVHDPKGKFLYSIDDSNPNNSKPFLEGGDINVDDYLYKKHDKEFYTDFWKGEIYKQDFKHNNSLITCKSFNHQEFELHINADGMVSPCCFVGTARLMSPYDVDTAELYMAESRVDYDNHMKLRENNTLEDILDNGILNSLYGFKHYNSRRLYCCSTCGDIDLNKIRSIYRSDSPYLS